MTARLTTTSYTVLGLLGLGDWTAYDLAGLMARSVGLVLPRAPSVIYEEPKRLVSAGLATAREEARGKRSVAVYAITDAGRRQLREWLAAPATFPSLDAEAIVKTVFADAGSLDGLRATVHGLRVDAEARLAAILEQNEGYLVEDPAVPFPDRLPVIALAGRFPLLYLRFLVEWATWAEEQLAAWRELDDGSIDLAPLEDWAKDTFRGNRELGRRL